MIKYIFILSLFISQIAIAQTVTQPGLRDYQLSGAALPDSVLYIMGTDTLDGSAKQGLGKWYRSDSLFAGIAGDQDWYKRNTTLIPLNADSAYRSGFIQVKNGIETLNQNFNNRYALFQRSYKNTSGSGYMGHYKILYDSLAFPAISESYGRFPEWIEQSSWDNSINAGFENGGNLLHDEGFNFDLGSAHYNPLRPTYKRSIEMAYYPGSGSTLWVEGHDEVADTLGRITRPYDWAAAYDGSYAAFSTTSDRTFTYKSPDEALTGENNWENWNYPTGLHKINYDSRTQIDKVYDGPVLEKYSNIVASNYYRNILTHDDDDRLFVGDTTGIDLQNRLTFRINGYTVPLVKSNNYNLQFDTVFVNFLGEVATYRNFTLSTPGIADRMLYGYDGSYMSIGKFNDDETIFRIHDDAPNYSLGINSTGRLAINMPNPYALIDITQKADDLSGGIRFLDAASAYYIGQYIDGSDHWTYNFNGSEKFRLKSSGYFNGLEYDATPLSGTPFRLLAHETDGDFIAAGWLQVIDSLNANGLGGTDTDDQNLTIEGAGPTYQIAINDGTDVTVSNVYGLTLSEPVANTLGLEVDTSKLATQYDLTLLGSDHDWYEEGTTTAPNAITDTMFHTGPVAIGQNTAEDNYTLTVEPNGEGIVIDGENNDYIPLAMRYAATDDKYSLYISDESKFYITSTDATPITTFPFEIESLSVGSEGPTLSLRTNGDAALGDYPNTRDDGTPTNVLGTSLTGVIQSYPIADIPGVATDLTIGGAGPNYTIESSNGTDVTIAGAGIITLSETPANTLVITGTEVDGSISNELQTLSASGATTTYGIDLSAGGGTVNLIEGTNVTIDRTGNDLTINASASGGMTSWLLAASGTGGTESITDGETVTYIGAGINAVTRSTNNITITGTEVDGSVTNEAWTIDGDAGDTEVISNQTVLFDGTGIVSTTYTAASNTLTINATEVDGSTTNELNTIEENNVSVQTGNSTIDFQTLFDVATDGAGEVNISLDLSEATTVTTVEADDYIIMHDAGSSQHQKMLWTDFSSDLITFYDGASLQGTGNAIDVGSGLDINMVGSEANINLDASEFQIDPTAEGTEYVLIHDIDTTAGHQIQRRLVSSFGGGTDTHFGGDDLTWDGNRVHDQSTFTTEIGGTNMSWKFQDNNATSGATITLAGNVGNSDAPMGQIQFMYDDAAYATDQTAWTVVATRETDDLKHSTLEIASNEAASAPPVATWEMNENLSDNTQETSLRLNSGIAFTQYFESTAAGAITLDRGYRTISLASGHSGQINLPEIYGIDESNIEIPFAQVPIGQEYIICNYTGGNITLAAFNGTTTNDDFLNEILAGTITMTDKKCYTLRAVRINGTQGYWKYWISD